MDYASGDFRELHRAYVDGLNQQLAVLWGLHTRLKEHALEF